MKPTGFDPEQTKLSSRYLKKMTEQRGFLVRLYPVAIGDGVITLPDATVTLGRDAECELFFSDRDISRRHASIESTHGMFMIRDLGSTNGTLVNDKKIQATQLVSGDLIRVGKTVLKFLRGDDVEKQYHETIYSMVINDGLTGVPNKRFLTEALQRELTRSQRHNRPLSLVVVDIDHFKSINDKYGHLAGDVVLRELCRRVSAAIRKDELFARYGGEEFVALLPESALEEAARFAERIRKLIASQPFDVDGGRLNVTISLGVAHTAGEAGVTEKELFDRADRKLYEAKGTGRNKVVW